MRTVLTIAALPGARLAAQQPAPYVTDVFPVEEFAGRRARVIEQIGEGIAILQVAPEMAVEVPRREPYNGPELGPGHAAAAITGIEAVVERDRFASTVAGLVQGGRTLGRPEIDAIEKLMRRPGLSDAVKR